VNLTLPLAAARKKNAEIEDKQHGEGNKEKKKEETEKREMK
jgi:hypothetical protein